jgi:murein endopeptidase
MRSRINLMLLVGLLLSEELYATAGEPDPDSLGPRHVVDHDLEPATVLVVDTEDEIIPAATAAMPPARHARPISGDARFNPPPMDLTEVHWTVDGHQSLDTLSTKWGLRVSELQALNPSLQDRDEVVGGEPLVVYRADPTVPTQSVGAPNKGRLMHGLPLPEGEEWMLRPMRRRAFGTRTTIESLVRAFTVFGAEYPDTPPIRVGEISGPRGGRANPHKSHRSGRDVDIGYVLKNPPSNGWRRATPRDFDTERNWALIRALVETGNVQQIYVSAGLQKLLKKHAAKDLGPEELAVYFWDDAAGPQQEPILKHQDGHRDHMHVRFACEPENPRCRSKSIDRTKKKKRS